jgi:hypothetical protein
MKLLLNVIHYLIVLFTFTLPLFPVDFLRMWFWLPIILFFIWLIIGACPITIQTHGKGQSFTHNIFKQFYPNITQEQSSNLNDFLIVLMIVLASYKVIKCCEKEYPKECSDKWGWV